MSDVMLDAKKVIHALLCHHTKETLILTLPLRLARRSAEGQGFLKMNRPQDSQLPTKSTSGDTTRKTPQEKTTAKSKNYYLIAYNLLSAGLWAGVLTRTVLLASTKGYASVYAETFEYVKYVQTLAVLEILHAAVGMSSSLS